ncbi:MAG: hypothetical protein O3A47_08585 [Chloroflexi bacterium]|nr:hypothetical protein [Chloroflexota bacterium]
MGVILVPIVEGKLDVWKQWIGELNGSRQREFASFNSRYGLIKHEAWLAETPAGPVVIAIHEGPGSDDLMPKLGPSQDSFDVWFKGKLNDIHGMDVTQPPPGPMPVRHLG